MTSEFVYHSHFWLEEPELDNPFAARHCYCHGYDVYGQVITRAGWFEYLLLLFQGQRPSPEQCRLLETLAKVLANPGPRDASVRAAMNAGVSGTTPSSALIAALAAGSGQYGGGQEVTVWLQWWQALGADLPAWQARIANPEVEEIPDIWLPMEHCPGFDPNGDSTPTPVCQALDALATQAPAQGAVTWLSNEYQALEQATGYPLAMVGVASAALADLGLEPDQATMLYLILRLPGAAVHALEQKRLGWKLFPYYGPAIQLLNDPNTPDPAREGVSP
ncbi:citrate/2-methylcitrate synthase [Marinobacter xestospongiae]|uniref:citrate/2-methylcitrate synthase n=1 Tax=Marinobacter xestospongiae TaxID=994319 RepID=UPI0020046E4B|nr:citrate/2-methylcitrate synthase [Marinobacter xestospongiae]MCK7568621.1 citryl-CoA lyase [Marinobacter xestospongiae]